MRNCENCLYWVRISPALGQCTAHVDMSPRGIRARVTWEDQKCESFKKKEDKK